LLSPDLITGRRTQTLLLFCAWWIVLLAIFLVLVWPAYDLIAAHPLELLAIRIIGGFLGVVGSIAAVAISFGMLWYLVRYDRASVKSRVIWFMIFGLTFFFGSTAYFFAVYRRQVAGSQ
jgi:hypothetical protein